MISPSECSVKLKKKQKLWNSSMIIYVFTAYVFDIYKNFFKGVKSVLQNTLA